MVREFIRGWDLMQILGEGTFAEVKLLVNRQTGEACAMKEIDLAANPAAVADAVKKEICVHKLLDHENVVRCYGSRTEGQRQFIFLEYCAGGELFDRIEPEVGMPEHQAQHFFKQVLAGVEYLHSRGIAHRDIKPENLLLSDGDVLKISDFGMATVFRHKGKERLLERRCGTLPYIAPEVLMRPQYNAEPADVWSCGMVLLAMLTGELPWDRPTPDQTAFLSWRDNDTNQGLWLRVESLPLSLLRKVVAPAPSKRGTLSYAKSHLWCKKKFKDGGGNLLEPELVSPPLKKLNPDGEFICATQPIEQLEKSNGQCFKHPATSAATAVSSPSPKTTGYEVIRGKEVERVSGSKRPEFGSFSQPAQLTNCYTGTQQSTQTPNSQSSIYQRLVKRMTRFWVEATFDKAEHHLKGVLKKLGYAINCNSRGIYTIETTDRRGAQLVFKCMFIQLESRILVDFRLSRGCGLEFKRHFAKIKANCRDILDKAPILWPALIPASAIPVHD